MIQTLQHCPDDPTGPMPDTDVAAVERWRAATVRRRQAAAADAQHDHDATARHVERMMAAEAQVETALADEEFARLVGLIGESAVRRYVSDAQRGDRLCVYVCRGYPARVVRVGPARAEQEPPVNFGASEEWRRSQWRPAGVYEVAAIAARLGDAPAVAEVA